ncbi:Os05g0546450 [Oryza sativa Japonica Group]|uniref:Os05g0546450 protein n=1 Tax=Oryza sativa subsp. japonica TaxID=39947 RepID=A0A0N7KL67_ORYSJ|nr:Os05g0546450 [Oryza sativa Japonica Group]
MRTRRWRGVTRPAALDLDGASDDHAVARQHQRRQHVQTPCFEQRSEEDDGKKKQQQQLWRRRRRTRHGGKEKQ